MIAAALLLAQMITPADAREEKRFAAATTAAARAGYAEAAVFWHRDDWFVVEGTSGGMERFLLFVIAPAGKPSAVLQLAKSERLNMLSVEVEPMFEGVVDVVLSKQPFQYESSTTQVTHDLIALSGKPRVVCHIDGSVTSSTAKGPNTWEHHREVKLTLQGDALVVTSTEESVIRPNHGPGEETRTPGPSTRKRYLFPAGGACKEASGD